MATQKILHVIRLFLWSRPKKKRYKSRNGSFPMERELWDAHVIILSIQIATAEQSALKGPY